MSGGYRGLQGVIEAYTGLQGVTGGYKGLREVTGGNRWLDCERFEKVVTRGYRELQAVLGRPLARIFMGKCD